MIVNLSNRNGLFFKKRGADLWSAPLYYFLLKGEAHYARHFQGFAQHIAQIYDNKVSTVGSLRLDNKVASSQKQSDDVNFWVYSGEKSQEKTMKRFPIQTQEHISTPCLDRTDAVLAKQVLDGDQEAFELLVERYSTPLFNFVCRCLGDYDLACDVLQQVFLRLYISLPKLGTGEPFKAWLFQVARNCCIDELRRKYRSAVHFSQFENSEGDLAGLSDIPDPEPLPEEVAERHDLQALLQGAIQSLPPKFRSVVILRYVSQMSFPEIGQVLAIPETTAKTYFHRAKVLLRKAIIARLQPYS